MGSSLKPEIVKVLWKDAWIGATEPINLEEVHLKHRPMLMTTLGWLLCDDEEGVSIANEQYYDEDDMDTYRGRTFIPRGMVQEIIPFKPPRSKKKVKAPDPQPPIPDNPVETEKAPNL